MLRGTVDTWALQSHSINASLDPALVFTCYVLGERRDTCQFPKREKKQLEKRKWQIVNEIAFVSIFPPLFCF